jgi:hypothetical protein
MKYDGYGRLTVGSARPSRTDTRRRVRRISVGTGRSAEPIVPAPVVARTA